MIPGLAMELLGWHGNVQSYSKALWGLLGLYWPCRAFPGTGIPEPMAGTICSAQMWFCQPCWALCKGTMFRWHQSTGEGGFTILFLQTAVCTLKMIWGVLKHTQATHKFCLRFAHWQCDVEGSRGLRYDLIWKFTSNLDKMFPVAISLEMWK